MNDKQKLDTLTSLRFFAAAMIVAYHGAGRGLGPAWLSSFALGQGVTFFFVLSGFVLSYNYTNFPARSDVIRFYWARVARIWPLHIATGALYVAVIGNISYFSLPPDWRFPITLAYVSLVHAWIPVSEFITAYNTVSWSISTEFFFYLVFPVLIWRWPQTGRIKLLITFSLTCLMWWLSSIYAIAPNGTEDGRGNLAYINPLARVFEFALGISICHFYRSHLNSLNDILTGARATCAEVGLLCVAVGTLWLSMYLSKDPEVVGRLGKTSAIVFSTTGMGTFVFSLVILVFAVGSGGVSRILRAAPMVFLGEISFGLYLVHTLFLLYRQQAPGVFSGLTADTVYFLYWGSALTLAMIVHILVEKPGQHMIRAWSVRGRPEAFSYRQLGKVALYVFIVSVFVLVQPSTRSTYQPTNDGLVAKPVEFQNGFRLDQVEILPTELAFSWTASQDVSLSKRVAVHLLDDLGVMRGQLDFAVETGYRNARSGEQWRNLVALNGFKLESVRSLGVAVYDQHGMTRIESFRPGETDWNGTRLIVPLAKYQRPLSLISSADVVGNWNAGAGVAKVSENSDGTLSMLTETGLIGLGVISGGKIDVPAWGVYGRLSGDQKTIAWSNGFYWRRH